MCTKVNNRIRWDMIDFIGYSRFRPSMNTRSYIRELSCDIRVTLLVLSVIGIMLNKECYQFLIRPCYFTYNFEKLTMSIKCYRWWLIFNNRFASYSKVYTFQIVLAITCLTPISQRINIRAWQLLKTASKLE